MLDPPGQGQGQPCIPGDAPPKSGQPRDAPASRDVLLAQSIKVSPDKERNLVPQTLACLLKTGPAFS